MRFHYRSTLGRNWRDGANGESNRATNSLARILKLKNAGASKNGPYIFPTQEPHDPLSISRKPLGFGVEGFLDSDFSPLLCGLQDMSRKAIGSSFA